MNIDKLFEANKEIAALKEQIANMTLAKSSADMDVYKMSNLSNDVVDENNALKAQIELLRNKLGDVVIAEQNNSGYEPSLSCFQREITEASILLAQTPRQCLASTQVKAINDSMPELHSQGLGCGLEDRDITDRYEAAEYGFNECLEQIAFNANQLKGNSNEKTS